MRYVDGSDLARLLRHEGPLEPSRALDLVGQLAEALDAAHARGLVHRDVKPSNTLIAREGAREHVYLADFGLTRTSGPDSVTATPRGHRPSAGSWIVRRSSRSSIPSTPPSCVRAPAERS